MSSFYPGGGDPELGEGVAAAEAFAIESKNWANQLPDPVDGSEFSSKKYAQDSSTAASQSASSAADAAQSASDADDALQAVLQQNLEDINNVTITSVQTSEVLTWSGTAWVNSPAAGGGGATVLNDLLDVDTTGVSNGQVLLFSGGTWQDSDNFSVDPTTGSVTTSGNVASNTLNVTGQSTLGPVLQGATTFTGNIDAASNDADFRDTTQRNADITGSIESNPQVCVASGRFNQNGTALGANYGIQQIVDTGAGTFEILLTQTRANIANDCTCNSDMNFGLGGTGSATLTPPVVNNNTWIRLVFIPQLDPLVPTDPVNWGIIIFDAGRT